MWQVLTIRGHSFTSNASAIEVAVGGTPCKVIKASPKFIQCRISDRDASAALDEWQPGSRGVDMRFFKGSSRPGSHPTSGLTPFRHDTQEEYFVSPADISNYYFSQHRSFFRVPATGSYQFLVAGDDEAVLYVGLDGNMSNVEKVAWTSQWTTLLDYTRRSSQRSVPMDLREGQLVALYVEHLEGHGADHSSVGILFHNTSFSSRSMTGGGVIAPHQTIHLKFPYNAEKQLIHVGPATGGAQSVGGTFSLRLEGRATQALPFNASAEAVRQALTDATEARSCSYRNDNSPTQRIFDLDQFEDSVEWGSRNGIVPYRALGESYCGRFGLGSRDTYGRNFEGRYNPENQTSTSYDVAEFPYMCAAFKIPRGIHVSLLVSISGVGWRSISVTQPDEGPLSYAKVADFGWRANGLDDGQWHYRCINVLDQMRAAMPTRTSFTVGAVIYHSNGFYGSRSSGHFFLDEFSISAEPREVVASPQPSTRIKSIAVTKTWSDETGASYDVKMETRDCAGGLSSIEVDASGLTGGGVASVDRYQPQSTPIGGTMSVDVLGQTVTFSPTANGGEIADAVREQTTLRDVEAWQWRTCDSGESMLSLRLNDHAGAIHAKFKYDLSGVTGDITHRGQWFHGLGRGGALNKRLPATWLQAAVRTPLARVSVHIHGHSAVCANTTCGFDFRRDYMPTVGGVGIGSGRRRLSGATGTAATTLTISGSGFGSEVAAVRVTVGGTPCNVTAVTDTQVTCSASSYTAGKNLVKVYVGGVGRADGDVVADLPLVLQSVQPTQAYVPVQTVVKVSGVGFSEALVNNVVQIGDQTCVVVAAAANEVECVTSGSGSVTGVQDIMVQVKGAVTVVNVTQHGNYTTNSSVITVGVVAAANLTGVFDLKAFTQPSVTAVAPRTGSAAGGTHVTIQGANLDSAALRVFFGPSECDVTSRTALQVECTTRVSAPGNYSVSLVEDGLDTVTTSSHFTFVLALTSVAAGPTTGSYRGGVTAQLSGQGFSAGNASSSSSGGSIVPYLRTAVPDVQVVGLYAARPTLDIQRVTLTATLVHEVQDVLIVGASSGTFTLSLGGATTAALAFDANEYVVAAALRGALPGASEARVSVTTPATGGRKWSVTFRGGVGDVALMTADASALTAGATVEVTEVTAGADLGGSFRLALGGSQSASIAADASAATVKAAVEAMNGTGIVAVTRQNVLTATSVGSEWVVTFESALPTGTRGSMTVDTATLVGTSPAAVVTAESVGSRSVSGTFTLTVGGVQTAPLAYDASAADVAAAISALSSVKDVEVQRVDNQPGKKFGSWYPHQWLLSLYLTNAPQANGTVACTNPDFIDWRPDACPSHAADLYLSHHVAEFPARLNKPSNYGSAAHIEAVQALCDAEARSLGMIVGGCQARIVPQTRPYCAGPLGSSAPPCWVERWNVTKVMHLDGSEVEYLYRSIDAASDTQKGFRFWQPLEQVRALRDSFTRVNMTGLSGTGAGLDATRRRPGGYVEQQLGVASASDTSMTVTIPPAHVATVASYSKDLADLGMAVALAHYSMEGAHGKSGIVVNSGSVGTPADARAHNMDVARSEDETPRGFNPVFGGTGAVLPAGAFASMSSPPTKVLAPVGDFTVEGWFMPSSTRNMSRPALLAGILDSSTSSGYGLFLSADGKWEAWVGTGGDAPSAGQLRPKRANFAVAQSSTTAADDVWTHVAATYAAASATLTLFVNGAEAGSTTLSSGVIPSALAGQRPFIMGGGCAVAGAEACGAGGVCQTHSVCTSTGQGTMLPPATLDTFEGAVDEVAVYNVAVSTAELLEHATFAARTTSKMQFALGMDTTVRVGCATPSDCTFTYSEAATMAVTAISPDTPLPGGTLTVFGAHLDLAGASISFGGADWGCTATTSTHATCTVPAGQPAGDVSVTASADSGAAVVSYSAARITVLPQVTSLQGNETSLLGGTTLTITGTGFGTDMGAVAVGISWWSCAVTSVSQTSITCTVPRVPVVEFPEFITEHTALVHPVSVTVSKVVATGCHSGDSICRVGYLAASTPAVTQLSLGDHTPVTSTTLLTEGTTLSVTGTGFSTTSADNVLTLAAGDESVACTPVGVASAAAFNCTLGAGVGGAVSATFAVGSRVGLVAGAPSMDLTKAVVVETVSPAVGSQAGGSTLTLTGRGFSRHTSNVVVKVGGATCAVQSATPTMITCVTPAAPLPAFSASYRRRLREERAVPTLRGLSASDTGASVAALSSAIDVSVRSVAATAGDACATAKCMSFWFNATHTPVMTQVSASGTTITITGSGFSAITNNNTVVVGGTTCDVSAASSDSLTCTLAQAPTVAGSYGVRVSVADKGLAALHANATHGNVTVTVQPTVTAIDVASGSYAGGVTVTLSGTGFNPSASDNRVSVCGADCPVSAASGTSLSCVVPPAVTAVPLMQGGTAVFKVASGSDDAEEVVESGETMLVGSTGTTACAAGVGLSFRGPESRTVDGHTCQRWDVDTPHKHGWNAVDTWRGIGPHNYCRNPTKAVGGPWCYTTTTSKRWDYCSVPKCNQAENKLDLGDPRLMQGLRFASVRIPRGSTITRATLRLTASLRSCGHDTTMLLRAQDSDNAPGFTGVNHDISSRQFLQDVNVTWAVADLWKWRDGSEESADFSSLLQAMVNRPGWRTGNAVVLAISHVAGSAACSAFSAEQGEEKAPELVVEFDPPAAATAATIDAVKQCPIEVRVTHTANGMAGLVRARGEGDGGVDGDVVAALAEESADSTNATALLPLEDLAVGALVQASHDSMTHTTFTREMLDMQGVANSYDTFRAMCIARGGDLCPSDVVCPPAAGRNVRADWFEDPNKRMFVPTLDGGRARGSWVHVSTNTWGKTHACNSYDEIYGGSWGDGSKVVTTHRGLLPCCYGHGFPTASVADGEPLSQWRSSDTAGADGSAVALVLDIRGSANTSSPGGTQVVREFAITFVDDHYAAAYTVEVSLDGDSWSQVLDFSHGTGHTLSHDLRSAGAPFGVSARFVRVKFASPAVKSSAGGALYRVAAIRLTGHASATTSVVVPAGDAAAFEYHADKSPTVSRVIAKGKSPARGTTAGNTLLTIMGTGFSGTTSTVTVGELNCPVQDGSNTTHVFCLTPAVGLTQGGKRRVTVTVPGVGASLPSDAATFTYADLWSSKTTWGGGDPPVGCGDFVDDRECVDSVVIPKGQVITLDVTPPRLYLILIQGTLIFDNSDAANDLELRATYLIVHGGALEIGTEDEPYKGKAAVTLFGHFGNVELPSFGAKVLGCYKCRLDLHGQPHERAWTRLAATASVGDTQLVLQESVASWPVGAWVVVSTTSFDRTENEVRTIASVSADGKTLQLNGDPLKFGHFRETVTVDGQDIEYTAKVGLLTHNVVIQGDADSHYCAPDDVADTGLPLSCNRFGGHTFLHSPGHESLEARVSGVEFRNMGQAFRLGRYTLHYHMIGNVRRSYVRGNSFHHNWNRGLAIHGSHYLRVTDNVGYHIFGHTYFIEDGIEHGNILDKNLGIRTMAASSLLNTDMTPAVFWVTNPDNIITNNVAVGSDNYGFWYRPELEATGTSTHTPEVHPSEERMGVCFNNEAHSHGKYGFRVFPAYNPKAVANFDKIHTWRNAQTGVAATSISTFRFNNLISAENKKSGFECRIIFSPWGDAGIYDSLFIGRASLPGSSVLSTTGNGIWTPHMIGFEIHNTTFANYVGKGGIEFCAHCGRCGSPEEGKHDGMETRTSGLKFVNCPNSRVRYRHKFEGILHDMDGSLTGLGPDTYMVGKSNIMPPTYCTATPMASLGAGAAVCKPGVRPRRVMLPPVQPSEYLEGIDGTIRSESGVDTLPYIKKGGELKIGYMFTGFANYRYTFDVKQKDVDVTSMSMDVWEIADGEYMYLTQRFEEWRAKDIIDRPLYHTDITTYLGSNEIATNLTRVFGDDRVGNALVPRPNLPTGSYAFELDQDEIGGVHTMLIRACDDRDDVPQCTVSAKVKVLPCPKAGCWPPPPLVDQSGKEGFNRTWSNATTWAGNPNSLANPLNVIDPETGNTLVVEQQWAGTMPSEGDNVWIPRSMTVILDVSPPALGTIIIDGTLIISDEQDIELRARGIIINGGELVAGSPTKPHQHKATITLMGDKSVAPMVLGREGYTISSKSLVVGGNLTLYGQPRTRWTHLAATANAGATTLSLEGGVNWEAGDVLVVASTSFDPARSERRTIASVAPGATAGTTDVTLTEALAYKHFSGVETHGTRSMSMKAEVGLLSHNIVIQGDDNGDHIGAQVFVGEYSRDVWSCDALPCVPGFVQYLEGIAQVHNVEMRNLGQFGRMNRAGVVMQTPDAGRLSSFADSSMHTVWNRGFYVPVGDGIKIERVTLVDTVGSSVYIAKSATNAVLRENLVMGMKMPLTFLGQNSIIQVEPVRANFEMWGPGVQLHGNAAAGSQRGAYAGVGMPWCGASTAEKSKVMSNNVAHSSLIGWFSHRMGGGECNTLHDLTIYKILDYGVFVEQKQHVELSSVRVADTKVGIHVILVGPDYDTRFKLKATMSDVLLVGASDNEECSLPSGMIPYMCLMDNAWCKPTSARHVGLFIPVFASNFNKGPKIKEWSNGDKYPAIEGEAWLRGVTFAKFGMSCGKRNFMMIHNPLQPDAAGPLQLADVQVAASEEDSYIHIAPPKEKWVNIEDCAQMDCMGPKHVFVHDTDGSMLGGDSSYFLPRAEHVSRRAEKGTFPPTTMMADHLGRPLDEADVIPNGYGLVRPSCTLNAVWNAYKCSNGLTYRRFVLSNLDRDREIRSLSPVAISADGWTDLMNELMDHSLCLGYACLKRLTTYHGIMATGRRYQIHLSGSNPIKTRFHINGAAPDEAVVLEIYYMGSSRLNVFTGPDLSNFHEDINMLDGKRKALLHKQGRIAGNNADGSWTDDTVELGDAHGTNAYNRRTKMIHVAIKGDGAVLIQQMPVVQVGMNLAVSEADFYEMEDEFISSMASLLGIPPSRIAITDVVPDDGLARRRLHRLGAPAIVLGRRTAGGVQVEFEVAPSAEVNLQEEDVAVLETVGTVNVTITRSVNVLGTANFTYDTVNGTAKWGTHFTRVHGIGQFADRETTKTITIPILAGDEFDAASPRTFKVKIAVEGDNAGAVVGARGEVSVSVSSITPPVIAAPTLAAPPAPSILSVQWPAPTWSNAPTGHELKELVLQHRDPTSQTWEEGTSTTLPVTTTVHALTGLDTYSAHQFRIRVTTESGSASAWSPVSDVLYTLSVCGDNRRQGTEGCDDGNENDGDGCSAVCQPEAGFACTGGETGGSDVCEAGCGDGLRAGAEQCDANGESLGCVACRVVLGWNCTGGSASSKDTCTSVCGDGVTATGAEACDDGNTKSGDGCSTTCVVETNYTCTTNDAGLATCQSCGNGVTEGSEVCDDAGAAGGCNDACSGIDAGWLCTTGSPDVCVGGPATPSTAPRSTLATTDSLTFAWDAVSGNGLDAVSYTLEVSDEAAPGVWHAGATTNETRATVSSLRSSASFRARVSATTTAGTSGWSPVSDVASTLDEQESVTLDTEEGASSELGGLVDTLVSGAATSDYLGNLGVGGFELTPPVPPPAVPLEDDGALTQEEYDAALAAAAAANTTAEDLISESGDELQTETTTVVSPVTVSKGEFGFATSLDKVTENNGVLNVTVKRNNGAFSNVTVEYATVAGTAQPGVDYTAATGTLAFAAGQLTSSFTVATIDNDRFVTTPLKFSLVLRNPTGGAELAATNTNMTVSIQDDDTATLVEFSAATASVAETAGSVTLSLKRSRSTGADMAVQVALTEVAPAATDSVFSGDRTVTVTVPGAGATFTVPVLDSKTATDTNRQFTATLTSTTNGLLGATTKATVSLTHVDCRPRDNCANGALCANNADCVSSICTGFGRCAATATCSDLAKNGAETDVDCGGGTCDGCALTKACSVDSDCVSGAVCEGDVCVAAPTCDDNVKNGKETDVDCGGVCLQTCAAGKQCSSHMDCGTDLSCNSGVCEVVATCSDGMKSAGEADVDCGGVCTKLCAKGKTCSAHAHCERGVCSSGVCSANYRVDGSLNLVGYKTSELTPRVLDLIKRGLATHLGVPEESVHVQAGGSRRVRIRLLVRSASDVATVTYSVYGATSEVVAAKADTLSSPSNAGALQTALQAQGLEPLSVTSSAGSVKSVSDVVYGDDGSSKPSTMVIMLIVVAVVLVGGIVAVACFTKSCGRTSPDKPVKPATVIKPEPAGTAAATASTADGGASDKPSLNGAAVARMEARSEYVVNGQVLNTETGSTTALDPSMYNYYNKTGGPAAGGARGGRARGGGALPALAATGPATTGGRGRGGVTLPALTPAGPSQPSK